MQSNRIIVIMILGLFLLSGCTKEAEGDVSSSESKTEIEKVQQEADGGQKTESDIVSESVDSEELFFSVEQIKANIGDSVNSIDFWYGNKRVAISDTNDVKEICTLLSEVEYLTEVSEDEIPLEGGWLMDFNTDDGTVQVLIDATQIFLGAEKYHVDRDISESIEPIIKKYVEE